MSATDEPVDLLFVGHEATRTGAPLMLLYFLRWLREHTDLRFEIVLLKGGPILDDFAAVAPVTTWDGAGAQGLSPGAHAAPTVYCNGVRSTLVLPHLAAHPTGRTVITHVHELEGGIQMSLPEMASLESMFRLTDHWVVASDLVGRNLIDRHGVDAASVARHYEFIDVANFAPDPRPAVERSQLLEGLGIPAEALVVGSMGTVEWRKGPDLFLALAVLLAKHPVAPVHLVWVGADPARPETEWLGRDLERLGLGDRVHVVGIDDTPARWLASFDVFALTAREDPFPLVCLESSLLEVPIVCFDNTGMVEFADDGRYGYIVPYLDIEAMAEQIVGLLDDPGRRAEVGARAAAHVRSSFDVSVGAPRLHAELEGWRRDG